LLSLSRYLITSKQKIVCLLLFNNFLFSQNLIQNGSFENYTNIDCTYGGFDNGNSPYNHVMDNWYGYNSPDYFNTICNLGWFNVPNNIFGYSFAKLNNAYVGISVFQANNLEYKEYIYQQLLSPLQSGKIYCLNFYVLKADRKEYAIMNIGAYFCSSLPSMVSNGYINANPQVANASGFISDTTQWTQIQGCFAAIGGEQYVIIGNFNSNANTDTIYTGTNNPIPSDPQYAYYYIDDVTLIDQSTVGLDELSNGNSMTVYPNPANEKINFQFSNAEEKRKIELYDAIGNLLIEKDARSNNLSLTTDSLSNGVYFFSISVGEKTIKTDKIVIIK
jgi:hypothetical protein